MVYVIYVREEKGWKWRLDTICLSEQGATEQVEELKQWFSHQYQIKAYETVADAPTSL